MSRLDEEINEIIEESNRLYDLGRHNAARDTALEIKGIYPNRRIPAWARDRLKIDV
jgi:hypothetical protein